MSLVTMYESSVRRKRDEISRLNMLILLAIVVKKF